MCVSPCSSWRSGCAGFAAPQHGGGCCRSLCSLPGTNPCCAWSSRTSEAWRQIHTQRKNINKKNESTDTQGLGSLLTPADCCKNRHKQLGLSRVGKPERVCSLLQCSNIYPGQHTEKWTASIKSILSGSLREQLVAYGVLATSSYYCSVSKTAARSVLLQPAILFYSLQHRSVHFSPCLFLFCDAAVIARAVCVAARVGGGAPEWASLHLPASHGGGGQTCLVFKIPRARLQYTRSSQTASVDASQCV